MHIPQKLIQIANDIRACGGRVFLVGGWVRDYLLEKNAAHAEEVATNDYDLEVYCISQEALLSVLSKYGKPNLIGKAFGVIHLSRSGVHYDFSFPRTESKNGAGHRAFDVQTNPNLTFEEAAKRRDFTINAMGMELPNLELSDPYGGQQDLRNKILRNVSEKFSEDSLRVIRGVQFAARFELRGAPETIELCKTLSLADLSRERIEEEFRKFLLKGIKPSFGLDFFVAVGLPKMFPEIAPNGDWKKLGEVLDFLAAFVAALNKANVLLKTEQSALPVIEDDTKQFKETLMFSALLSSPNADVVGFLKKWIPVNHLLKKVPATLGALKFLDAAKSQDGEIFETSLRRGALQADGLKLPAMLDLAINRNENFYLSVKNSTEKMQIWENAPEPLLTGQMLLDIGMKPGKHLGELIKHYFELQLDGKIVTREEVAALVRDLPPSK